MRIRVRRKRVRRDEAGYMLLMLMLAVTMIVITLMSVVPNYRRSILRDREVEMIHRGEQYERAIRIFYRNNGSKYPTSLEQLENMNKVRYLRRRYKDPMTKDGNWRLVHITDLAAIKGMATGLAGTGAGAAQQKSNSAPTAFAGDLGAAAAAEAAQQAQQDQQSSGTSAFGGTGSGSAFGGAGSSSTFGGAGSGSAFGGPATSGSNPATSGDVLGGGLILGVVSKSKVEGLHSFNNKTHYNEWFFVYDPTQDRGQLISGPYNPNAYIPGGTGMGAGSTTTPGNPLGPGAAGTGLVPTQQNQQPNQSNQPAQPTQPQ
jgi:type II secretory pathway pseudopilin PulG